MQSLTKEIEDKLMCLPPIERACIAEKLLSSLDSTEQNNIDRAWVSESEDRMQAFEQGNLQASDASDVHRRLEKKYNI